MDFVSLPIEFNQIVYVILLLLVPSLIVYIKYSLKKQDDTSKNAELEYRKYVEGIIDKQGKSFDELEERYERYLESIDLKQDKLLMALTELRVAFAGDSSTLKILNTEHHKRCTIIDQRLDVINAAIEAHNRRLDNHEIKIATIQSNMES